MAFKEIDDKLWELILPYLPPQKPKTGRKTGRPRANLRKSVNGILYVIKTGCSWECVPEIYGSKSTIHRLHLELVKDRGYERLEDSYLGLVQMMCVMMLWGVDEVYDKNDGAVGWSVANMGDELWDILRLVGRNAENQIYHDNCYLPNASFRTSTIFRYDSDTKMVLASGYAPLTFVETR